MSWHGLWRLRLGLMLSPLAALLLWALCAGWLAAETRALDDAITEQNALLMRQLAVLARKSEIETQVEALRTSSNSGAFLRAGPQSDWAGALQAEVRQRLTIPDVALNSLEPMENVTLGGLSWTRARLVLIAPNEGMLKAVSALASGNPVLRIVEARIGPMGASAPDLPPTLVAELVVQIPIFRSAP